GDEANLEAQPRQVFVKSKAGWRKVFLQWVLDAREMDWNSDDEEDAPVTTANDDWLPLPLAKLFGEDAPRPAHHRTCRPTFNREQLLMELLAAEHFDEAPDDGELSGSGDDYED
ncbi:hypothetical protein C8J57DRAFT_995911, partial [Mycena rebaudengoi]